MAKEARRKGTVKWFNYTKGFGFISPDDGGEEVFVHQSSIKTDGFRSLDPGEPVEFDVAYGDDGRASAVDVTGPDGSFVQGSGGGGGGARGGDGSRGGGLQRQRPAGGGGGGGEIGSIAKEGRQKGTVKWFNDIKGFGFISPDDGSEEVFVHQSSIKTDGFRSLAPGEPVEFDATTAAPRPSTLPAPTDPPSRAAEEASGPAAAIAAGKDLAGSVASPKYRLVGQSDSQSARVS